jgi:hypothetical protein
VSRPEDGGEFYVGYLPRMGGRLARFVAGVAAVLLLGAALLGWALPALHLPYDASRSDFGDVRSFEGILLTEPVPQLVVLRPGETGGRPFSRYLLVGRGKTGPRVDLAKLGGRHVEVKGSLVYRESQTLLAVKSAREIEPSAAIDAEAVARGEPLGRFILRGEIVDSKCFMGTMRPGNTKVHRACAARCISGGVPPVLLVRDENGDALYFVLVAADGSAVNERVLDLVAEPVEIEGDVVRLDDVFVLKADPATYRRL